MILQNPEHWPHLDSTWKRDSIRDKILKAEQETRAEKIEAEWLPLTTSEQASIEKQTVCSGTTSINTTNQPTTALSTAIAVPIRDRKQPDHADSYPAIQEEHTGNVARSAVPHSFAPAATHVLKEGLDHTSASPVEAAPRITGQLTPSLPGALGLMIPARSVVQEEQLEEPCSATGHKDTTLLNNLASDNVTFSSNIAGDHAGYNYTPLFTSDNDTAAFFNQTADSNAVFSDSTTGGNAGFDNIPLFTIHETDFLNNSLPDNGALLWPNEWDLVDRVGEEVWERQSAPSVEEYENSGGAEYL